MLISRSFEKSLNFSIGATRGGPMRARIISSLIKKPKNPNQLSKELNADYKTITHHLEVLTKMNWVIKDNNKYGEIYSMTFTPEEKIIFQKVNEKFGKKL